MARALSAMQQAQRTVCKSVNSAASTSPSCNAMLQPVGNVTANAHAHTSQLSSLQRKMCFEFKSVVDSCVFGRPSSSRSSLSAVSS